MSWTSWWGPILDGEVVLPAAEQLDPFIDADDIADVAVAALTDDRHIGETYELTSPRLMTFAEAVGEIAAATGRRIHYVSVSVEEYAAGAAELGVPEEFVEFLTYLFGDVLGGNAYVTDDVQRALGRRAPRLQPTTSATRSPPGSGPHPPRPGGLNTGIRRSRRRRAHVVAGRPRDRTIGTTRTGTMRPRPTARPAPTTPGPRLPVAG